MESQIQRPKRKDAPSVRLAGLTVEKHADGVRLRGEKGEVRLTLGGGFRSVSRMLVKKGVHPDLAEVEKTIAPLFPPDRMPAQVKARCCGGRTQKPAAKKAKAEPVAKAEAEPEPEASKD